MTRFASLLLGIALLFSACASDPIDSDIASSPDPTATSVPANVPGDAAGDAASTPTPVVIPTIVATETPNPTPTASAGAGADGADPTATPAATATAAPTATPRPIPTASPTSVPTAAPTAIVVSPTPRPIPTATAVPPTSTPTPTVVWVNPDCYVGPGAADEPVWWCGGKICVVGAPHYGCPSGPPPNHIVVQVGCTISDRDIVVGEVITLRSFQDPVNVPVRFAFNHGDGTIDNTSESYAYYEAPGQYNVTMLWQYKGGKGSTFCGRVIVRGTGPTPTPTPTPTPATVQIGCTITPTGTVRVGDNLVFRATQSPADVAVAYVFDHGDGTLDETSTSYAYYAAPGYYEVRLRWAHSGGSGTTYCGSVTVEPNFNAGDYLGRDLGSAQAIALANGLEPRTVRIDDQVFPGTTDYRLDRVNLEVDAGVVTKAYLG